MLELLKGNWGGSDYLENAESQSNKLSVIHISFYTFLYHYHLKNLHYKNACLVHLYKYLPFFLPEIGSITTAAFVNDSFDLFITKLWSKPPASLN